MLYPVEEVVIYCTYKMMDGQTELLQCTLVNYATFEVWLFNFTLQFIDDDFNEFYN